MLLIKEVQRHLRPTPGITKATLPRRRGNYTNFIISSRQIYTPVDNEREIRARKRGKIVIKSKNEFFRYPSIVLLNIKRVNATVRLQDRMGTGILNGNVRCDVKK